MSGYNDQVKENPLFQETKEKLDSIGPGMCLAKWTQVTLQLQTGHNHSCHHPRTHKINQKRKSQEIQVLYTIHNIKNFVDEKC